MATSRRDFLRDLTAVGATAATTALGVSTAKARETPHRPPDDAVGMLYDTTLCIGCKTCVVACHEANDLPPDTDHALGGLPEGLYDAPIDLSAKTKNVIKYYHDENRSSYVKRQCMHCVDPSCVGACMIGALQKREHGIVTWDADRCIGCRYCGVACPYNVPRFEWASRKPRIIKCELCNHRLAEGKIPACCEVCPRQAVIYGTYEDLLAEARRRLEENPGKYVPRIYGEKEGGGTQVLYLSHVPFEKLGFPELGEESIPALNRKVQHGVYRGMVVPAAVYLALGAVILRNRRQDGRQDGDVADKRGD